MAWGARLGSRWMLLLFGVAGLGIAGGAAASWLYQLFRGEGAVLSAPANLLFAGILLTIVSPLVAVGIVVFAMRHRDHVEEVFLVHRSGLLLVHFSKTLKADKDRDIVVAMLTALQSFVQEAFTHAPSKSLRQMDFGDRKIVIRPGSVTYLAIALRGRPSLVLRSRMRRTVRAVEDAYRPILADWGGETEVLEGADDVVRRGLLAGGIRGLRETFLALGMELVAWLDWRRGVDTAAGAEAKVDGGMDPQRNAAELLERSELGTLKPEYRDMMAAALQQIQEGKFTLVGVSNVYITLALQKNRRPGTVGWWSTALRTVREVLRTWPWRADLQAWVKEGLAPPNGAGTSAPATSEPPELGLLAKIPTLPIDLEEEPMVTRTTVGGPLGRTRRSRRGSSAKSSSPSRRSLDD